MLLPAPTSDLSAVGSLPLIKPHDQGSFLPSKKLKNDFTISPSSPPFARNAAHILIIG
jgi:hypothetical protein